MFKEFFQRLYDLYLVRRYWDSEESVQISGQNPLTQKSIEAVERMYQWQSEKFDSVFERY